MNKTFIEDDYCDFLDPTKICDNCGACLKLSDSDLQAIKIEEIAKNIDENQMIEADLIDSEFLEDINIPNWEQLVAKAQKLDPNMNMKELEEKLFSAYSDLNGEFKDHLKVPEYNLTNSEDITGDDIFDRGIIYLDDAEILESDLETETEEIFPGVRKLK